MSLGEPPVEPLFGFGQRREREAIRRLLLGPSPILADELGLNLRWAWLAPCIPTRKLLPGVEQPEPGDIDLLGGYLRPRDIAQFQQAIDAEKARSRSGTHPSWFSFLASLRILADGTTEWPPRLDFVFALEVKVSRAPLDGRLQRSQTGDSEQRRARAQALALCELGFDSVQLVRVLAGEPCPDGDPSPWLHAPGHMRRARDLLEDGVVANTSDPFSTMVAEVGPIYGRREDHAGSLSASQMGGQSMNPLRSVPRVQRARATIARTILDALAPSPVPRGVPVYLLCCSGRTCGKLFVPTRALGDPLDSPCPTCGAPSTLML